MLFEDMDCGGNETWSGEESENAEDLAELEARLYSQYHYEEDFLTVDSNTSSNDDDLITKQEDSLKVIEKSKCDINLEVEPIKESFFSFSTQIKEPTKEVKQKIAKQPRKLTRNPLYIQKSDGESSDSDTSEDEGIIAVSSDDSDEHSDISFQTIIAKHNTAKKRAEWKRINQIIG